MPAYPALYSEIIAPVLKLIVQAPPLAPHDPYEEDEEDQFLTNNLIH